MLTVRVVLAICHIHPFVGTTVQLEVASGGSPEIHSAIAYIHLQSGDLDGALDVANSEPSVDPYIRTLNSVLRATVYGEWEYAQKVLEAKMDTASEDVQ